MAYKYTLPFPYEDWGDKMKKSAVVLSVLILLTINNIHAQTSVGFSEPWDIKEILDYKLPSWGYQRLAIDFYSSGRDETDSKSLINTIFSPTFKIYRESEKNIWEVFVIPSIHYSYRGENPSVKSFESSFAFKGNIHYYIKNDLFIELGENLRGYYYKSWHGDNRVYSLNYTSEPSIGIGIGKIRDVTPIFRALRLNERLVALGKSPLSSQEIQDIAKTIAKRKGYISVYDRESKYFWRDLHRLFGPLQKELTAFDYYYLGESLIEKLGTRFNGWDLTARFSYSYKYSDQSTTTSYSTLDACLSLDSRWYKNINLNHQIGLSSSIQYGFSTEKKASENIEGFILLTTEHLWVVSDRLYLHSELEAFFMTKESKDYYYPFANQLYYYKHINGSKKIYDLSLELNYYIEDNFSLSNNISLIYLSDNSNGENTSWSYTLGFNYYPRRTLF